MRAEPLEPGRVRRPEGAYGWVDLRAVTEGHLERLGRDAALVYLFLCAVGDRQGISFWGRSKMGRVLGLGVNVIDAALIRMAAAELVAVKDRVFQVLPIPSQAHASPTGRLVREDRPCPATHQAESGSRAMPAPPDSEPQVSEAEIRACQDAARDQIARILGRREPSATAVRALAHCLALKARKGTSTNG